ncbi:DUF4123 domain-containing protein [Motilimonas sp. 1_MG-2023]|uniref:DUF4123 domain-containing protein n=1 Tax=Motilimonas sp. 1_MG-2023 TaxID=3062672 RepID=UPI0026E349F6|nr:DUF4123 domain-containing protein [Motilimonas sp. 1_MG-2023]MDO6527507.1 DUF4123 domain-containing protein [Motilimonas sp. 1_MG-2023]
MSDTQKAQVISQIDGVSAIDVTTVEQAQTAVNESGQSHLYAIIELCQLAHDGTTNDGTTTDEPNGLTALYQQGSGSAQWDFMFAPEQGQDLKQAGPILIALTEQADKDWLTQQLTQVPAGLFFTSQGDFNTTLHWAQQRLQLLSPNKAKSVCRFYDPRNVAFSLGAQTQAQQHAFWHQAQQLTWFDAGQWWQTKLIPSDAPLIEQYALSHNEIAGITAFKEQVALQVLINHYQQVKTKDATPLQELVKQTFVDAKIYGASTHADFDSWLRVVLVHGSLFYQTEKINQILRTPHYPLHKKIALAERELNHV